MKTSSKIAIAAVAIGAWLIAKKKGVAGIGKTFSGYQIKWLILISNNGIATKHDEELLRKYGFGRIGNVALARHCPNVSIAYAICDELIQDDELRHKLDKSYTCYEISDKQFGMIDARGGWSKEAILDVITKKQDDMRWTVYNGKE